MKKKTLILFISIIGLLSISLLIYGTGRPNYGDTHDSSGCHDNFGGYTISSTVPVTTTVNNVSYTIFNVTATGSNLFVQAYPGANDNDKFIILPTSSRIVDASGDDLDPNPNAITIAFNVTPTLVQNSYTLFILAGNNLTGSPPFAYVEIIIGAPPKFDLLSKIYDHLGLYLGLPALLLISIATVLVLVNENKFVKVHGILSGSAWILTAINLSAALIKISPNAWFSVYPLIYHVPHIILGFIGLISGFLSMFFGIAAERKPAKITGYIALLSWWAAFFLGYFLNNNLLLL
ncbi:MAG: hypothetical protein KGD58_10915 [Candidatus Lokiarchaeota archaeon]|nr:hypothetical protein [Candidatus Lokiarchaeota archaeon]